MILFLLMDLGPTDAYYGPFNGFSHDDVDSPERLLVQANRVHF